MTKKTHTEAVARFHSIGVHGARTILNSTGIVPPLMAILSTNYSSPDIHTEGSMTQLLVRT